MNVYIVEDDESMRMILKRLLRKNFPSVTRVGESESAEKALENIDTFSPDLVLVDISLPGMDGIEFIRRLHNEQKKICILVVTGHEIELYEKQAYAAGAHGIVSKTDDKQLLETIKMLLEKV